MRVAKVGVGLSLLGFLLSGISLALGHFGVGLKIVNLSFSIIFLSCFLGMLLK